MSDRKRRATDHQDAVPDAAATGQPEADAPSAAIKPNPPRTTTWGWFTAPKFGSAGGGGAELDPGPERD